MAYIRMILGDQLSHDISSLSDIDKDSDVIMLCEVLNESIYVKHHKKKIAFLFSAMRHFAQELRDKGLKVHYVQLDDNNNTGSFRGEVKRALSLYNIKNLRVTFPGEYRVLKDMETWSRDFKINLEILEDTRFLCSSSMFRTWASQHKQLRMEYFYRDLRKKLNILMDGDEPTGGQWNFDASNRKSPPKGLKVPPSYSSTPDHITQSVIALVEQHFSDHFGSLQNFHFAVNRKQALAALKLFIKDRLSLFGDYQDAMIEGEPWMYHSHLSFYLNCGLLNPKECIDLAEKAFREGRAPLNAVEGFIRQILGWREYVRGIYWLKMPDYASLNFFNATRALPNFYWTGKTKMNCIHQCVKETQDNSYAHHIQRLMVLGNFALLAGINPQYVNEWFLIVYADAFEWVEMPNVTGMILYADGGLLASKPYAAGGSYINKMSNYCQNCAYHVKQKNGEGACPFNYLYWHFLQINRDKLKSNPRLGMMYKTLDKMDIDKKTAIEKDSLTFLASLDSKYS